MTRPAVSGSQVAGRTHARSTDAAGPARWNERMTRILREAAEVRDELERAKSTEDARLAREASEACLALIGTLALPAVRPAPARGRPRSRDVRDAGKVMR